MQRPARKVILVTIDALRADRLGCYGYTKRPTSPNIDRLAGEGVIFEKAMVQAPWTGPSMGSVMTGHYPSEIGMYRNRDGIAKEFPMLAEHFQRAGFRTASFMANSLLLGKTNGFLRGFDDTSEPQRMKIPYADLEPHVFKWLEQHARESFFVWIHNMDPHPPATVGNAYREGREFPAYDAEVKWVDDAMGRLIDKLHALGIWNEVLFVFSADHGEAFGEHRLSGHQNVIYDEVLHVPLIVRVPRMKGGRRIAEPVELIDLYATMAELTGLQLADHGRSESLVPILDGSVQRRKKAYLFHSRFYFENNTHQLAVRDRQWKLIAKVAATLDGGAKPVFPPSWEMETASNVFELYRVDEDPRETKNRIAEPESAAVADRMKDALRGWQQITSSPGAGSHEVKNVDSGTLEVLRNLGYLE
jgi:arylsulfatase A-like enzyme